MVSVAASGSVFRAGMGHSEVLKAEIPVVMVFGDALHLSSYQMGELGHFRVLGGWLQIRDAL